MHKYGLDPHFEGDVGQFARKPWSRFMYKASQPCVRLKPLTC
jgi:hypothetical protein